MILKMQVFIQCFFVLELQCILQLPLLFVSAVVMLSPGYSMPISTDQDT